MASNKLWSTAKEHLHLQGITCPVDRAIMGSSGARQGKGYARTPCILWGRQHWTVCSDRQANLVQAVHGGRRRRAQWGLAVNLGQVCLKGIRLSSIPELRWHLLCKYMSEIEKLPPTLGALLGASWWLMFKLVQVWGQAAVPQQELLDPRENGYHRDSDDGQL